MTGRPTRLPRRARALVLGLACLGILGGCAREERREPAGREDPAIAAALADPIMSDPDLAGQDRSADAVAITAARPGPRP